MRHLLQETKSSAVLVSARTLPILQDHIENISQLVKAKPYSYHLSTNSQHQHMRTGTSTCNAGLILHSSGTTGFPKPIAVSSMYPLRYAACHDFKAEDIIDWVNLSTLPLYHGFGLLAPCLSLSIGMSCIFPPSSVIPAAHSTLSLLTTFGARSLMTVPSVVEEILSLPDAERKDGLEMLASLEFLAVGGGALSTAHGVSLAANHVRFLNHYGVTEIGPIAHIFRPTADYDWKYLRLRKDLGLELLPVEDTPHWKLSGPSANDNGCLFDIQDELELRPDSTKDNIEIRILGRKDDVIVLSTGEKVVPRRLEQEISKHQSVKTAVVVGNGYFEVAVLIEPVDSEGNMQFLIDEVWEIIQTIKDSLDAHSRVSSKHAIIIKPTGKQIPRSDKGSVLRQSVHDIFKPEIDAAYQNMESNTAGDTSSLSRFRQDPIRYLQSLVVSIASDRIDTGNLKIDDDMFERGMDSLQATRLVRLLNAIIEPNSSQKLKVRFIYHHPTLTKLANALQRHISGQTHSEELSAQTRSPQIMELADEMCIPLTMNAARHTVLLTGSTGSLGANVLAKLVRVTSVRKVLCFCRGSETSFRERQQKILSSMGLSLNSEEWSKVEVWTGLEHFQKPMDQDNEEQDRIVRQFAARVTHIMHLAWPMDFQRLTESFRPHLFLLQNLLRMAKLSHDVYTSLPVRLVFSSSIAVVRYAGLHGARIPEEVMENPRSSVPMGYAEAKWVCEKMLAWAHDRYGDDVDPVIVRVGQITGPESSEGLWKAEEHIPTLLKASQQVGALPDLEGTISWLPVDRAAQCLSEILLANGPVPHVLHLENPVRQPIGEVFEAWSPYLKLPLSRSVAFSEWLERAKEINAFGSLQSFFSDHFRDLGLGQVVLETNQARSVSKTLRETDRISMDTLEAYAKQWQKQGVLT